MHLGVRELDEDLIRPGHVELRDVGKQQKADVKGHEWLASAVNLKFLPLPPGGRRNMLFGKPLRLARATSCTLDSLYASRPGALSRCLRDTRAELMIATPAIRGLRRCRVGRQYREAA
jgi:hypothetical protein